MKILSKYKDFYDYLCDIYGVDEKLVLDRTGSFTTLSYTPSNKSIETFHIGTWMVQGLWMNGKIHFGVEVEQFADQKRNEYWISKHSKKEYWYIPDGKNHNIYCLKEPKNLGDKSPTFKENCPILIGNKNYGKFPILKDYSINKIFSAHDVYLILSEWLGIVNNLKEKQVNVSNETKIVNAGFDLKSSFRNIK